MDPNAPAGVVTNFPNPFHPPQQATTISYKLADHSPVTMRIFTLYGAPVIERSYSSGGPGGSAGTNEVTWDGRNGQGEVVASGGYIVLLEAQGTGGTLHVIKRKIAVVR
jgi:flagellar hook assembly protein FlgD